MNLENISGNVWKYGDDIDTDVIIPARYLNTSDPKKLARHCLEDLDEKFTEKMQPGDIIVAGDNFGCGSSREHAPLALKGAGVGCIIAVSFARIFYRNSINIGLPIVESKRAASEISQGDEVRINLNEGIISNITQDEKYEIDPFPPFIQNLIEVGGLIEYTRRKVSK